MKNALTIIILLFSLNSFAKSYQDYPSLSSYLDNSQVYFSFNEGLPFDEKSLSDCQVKSGPEIFAYLIPLFAPLKETPKGFPSLHAVLDELEAFLGQGLFYHCVSKSHEVFVGIDNQVHFQLQ